MEQSILKCTKKVLGIGEDDPSFDLDILMHINSVLSNLQQLGLGPEDGIVITDDTTEWDALNEDDPITSQAQTYVQLKVRMLFDPPTTPYTITAMEKQIEELESRLSMMREATDWADPMPPVVVVDE